MRILPRSSIILDTRKQKKSGLYPLKLRITYAKKQKYYPLDIDLSEEEYIKCKENRARGELSRIRLIMLEAEKQAMDVFQKLPIFNFEDFEDRFYKSNYKSSNVYDLYTRMIQELKDNGQVGTASNYECSLHSLQDYRKDLKFEQVTKAFLQGYQNHLISQKKSISTVGIYLRPLRSVYNRAIRENIIGQEYYPFGKNIYQIPTSRNIKKALSQSDLKKIFEFSSDVLWEQRARDYFIFSYLGNGMNMKDIALLKFNNCDSDTISFIRAKTHRTQQSQLPIIVPISEPLKDIILRNSISDHDNQNFIFPILLNDDSPESQHKKIQQFTKMVNKYLKIICRKLEIDVSITTYYARHSFSTILKNKGVSIEFISESLGHSNTITTKRYLDSFDIAAKKDAIKFLLPNNS